jgi:hypothetical protein
MLQMKLLLISARLPRFAIRQANLRRVMCHANPYPPGLRSRSTSKTQL